MKKGFEFLGDWFYRAFVGRIAKLAAMILLVDFATPSSHGQTLNATNLTWTTSGANGASGWTVQRSITHDGVLAGQSGQLY